MLRPALCGALILVPVTLLGVWMAPDETSDASMIVDRPWIERLPENPKERVHGMFLVKSDPIGAVGYGSPFSFRIEMALYAFSGQQLRLLYLQDEVDVTYHVRAWRCPDAPGDLDLCLDLISETHRLRLYSQTNWQGLDLNQALLRSVR